MHSPLSLNLVNLDFIQVSIDNKGSTDPKHLGPTSGIRATRGTLSKKNHKNNKHSLSRSRKMSQPADEFSQHLSDDDVSNHEDASDNGDATNKPKQQQRISTTTTISNIKLPILKKEEYDIWAMEMEHYLEYINNDVWKKFNVDKRKEGLEPPLLYGNTQGTSEKISCEWMKLREFGKPSWTRFGGLEKGYDRFQQLLSQLEAHGAEVSNEDANHKFLRTLPSAWSNLAMTMRTKPEIDTLSI
ncbi:hypothetical protein Tco_0190860 [Tanacetum coccineum]